MFDLELEPIKKILFEYPVDFPPSYPYEEDIDLPLNYMSTRCPSWCDRVLVSPAARLLTTENDTDNNGTNSSSAGGNGDCGSGPVYSIIGENICMGDHKVLAWLVCLVS